jgi:hypothetical protein
MPLSPSPEGEPGKYIFVPSDLKKTPFTFVPAGNEALYEKPAKYTAVDTFHAVPKSYSLMVPENAAATYSLRPSDLK